MDIPRQDYFQGILQLRNPSDDILEYVYNQVDQDDSVAITKVKKLKTGLDLYFTSQKYLQALGKKLQSRFGGELKVSSKLFSRNRQTSKDIYRVNVLFRMPSFRKGSIITYRGDRIQVISVNKRIYGKSLSTGKKVHIMFSQL